MSTNSLSLQQLKEAIQIKEQIATLESRLTNILGGIATPVTKSSATPPKTGKKRRGKMSAAGKARIVAAQKARWAKIKGKATSTPKPAAKPKKKKSAMSPEGRAKLAAIMKARWAARKKAGAPALNAPKKK